jgi:RNA polymerase sigma factor (sigma-70 family)
MDAYAHVLEALRSDGCRRLRAYEPRETTRFTTWLVVVTRRLVVDFQRRRYGRPRSEDDRRREEHAARRRLENLVASKLDPDRVTAPPATQPDADVRREQLVDALRAALDSLNPSDRLLLALRFEDERSAHEIAAVLRMPTVFHVYRRIGAVLAALRAGLVRRGVDEVEP